MVMARQRKATVRKEHAIQVEAGRKHSALALSAPILEENVVPNQAFEVSFHPFVRFETVHDLDPKRLSGILAPLVSNKWSFEQFVAGDSDESFDNRLQVV